MNKKLWEQFKNGEKIAINCKTEKESDKFMELCEKNHIKWWNGENATRWRIWSRHKESTCYTNGFDGDNGIGFGTVDFHQKKGYQIVTYTELMEDKKTFTGPELAQAILDGEFKAGVKFKSDAGFEYKICPYGTHLDLYDTNGKMVSSGVIIWRTFTLIEEPKLYYFNQVKNSGKKIKIKGWDEFVTLQGALNTLSTYNNNVINEAFNKKVWLEE